MENRKKWGCQNSETSEPIDKIGMGDYVGDITHMPKCKMTPPPAKSSDKEMSANTFVLLIFTARCYASAVPAMGLCPSVTSRRSIETAERIELVFGM